MHVDDIKTLLEDDLKKVNSLISTHLQSDIDLIKELGGHIVYSGGKRLRPMLTLLTARAFAYGGNDHIDLAVLIEFIHTATLLHDDVVDDSALRRGNETANAIWGNEASVLVGDFLFSRSFQMMIKVGNLSIMNTLADATNAITEGEVIQLMNRHNPDLSEDIYEQIIDAKTARLFSAASEVGAILAGQAEPIQKAMKDFGTHLGILFQLIDDALDYCGNSEEMGKNIGDDLAEGKATLPLIHALKTGTPEQQAIIRKTIVEGDLNNLTVVQEAIASTDAIAYTYATAQTRADLAIAALETIPASSYRDALASLVEYALSRRV